MTVAFPMSRSLTTQLLARSARSLTRPVSNPLTRVDCDYSPETHQSSSPSRSPTLVLRFKQARTYATAAAKPAGRPKQHTGRATAKSAPKSTKKAATAKKPAAKKPKKAAGKKAVKKVAKPRAKKAPSKASLLRKTRKDKADLKEKALLEEPKQLPSRAYLVVFVEQSKGSKDAARANVTAAVNKYKNLTLEEREQYNHEANQNKAQNEVAYKKWVQGYTPLEIKEANTARRQLTKASKAAGKKKTYRLIKDDRLVQRSRNSYSYFLKDRNDSGDLIGMTLVERARLIAQEWKKLSAAEKKTYEDKAKADMNRYWEEYKSVYGEDPPKARAKA